MELVVDANTLFAALIKISVTSDLLVDDSLNLYSVEFILTEFEKYEELIKNKTERTEEEFNRFMQILRKRIKLVSNKELEPFIKEAEKISPDIKDIQYFALALKLKIPIWSNDKKLKSQDKVKVFSTEEVKEMVEKKLFNHNHFKPFLIV